MTEFLYNVEDRKPMNAEERTLAIGVLRDARDLISPPGCWSQVAYARSSDGVSVGVSDPRAACWCLRGAVQRVAPTRRAEIHALVILLTHIEFVSRKKSDAQIGLYNDTHSHLEVIAVLSRAISDAPPCAVLDCENDAVHGQSCCAVHHAARRVVRP